MTNLRLLHPKLMLYGFLVALALVGCQPAAPTATPAPAGTPPPTLTPSPDPPVTLAVPTPVPYPTLAPTPRPTVSAIRRILDAGVLRVGIKLNEPPFGMLDREGNIAGYDADIARSLADSWGVELELAQVTKQTAVEYLLSGEVDLLIAAMAHRREREAYMDFSQSYFPDGQAAMVRADADISAVAELNQRTLAVVAGSSAEEALAASNLEATLMVVDTLDEAVTALLEGEVDAVVDSLVHLRVAVGDLGSLSGQNAVTILDEMLSDEPLAIGLPRYDVNLRNALNRTLQAMESGGRMAEIHGAWFADYTYPGIVTWEDDDARSFAEYPADMPHIDSILGRLESGETLYVAGLRLNPQGEGEERLEAFYRALVEEMASRWGAPVELLPESHTNPTGWVADGRAQLAAGVEPRWDGVDAVDYSQAFLLHGDRLMVRKDSSIRGFGDMRGDRVAVFDDVGDRDEARVNELALSVRVRLAGVRRFADAAAALGAINRHEVDAVFGDSLRLGPLVEANPDTVRFTERYYSQRGVAFAVPRNDADFRALVNFTLQDLMRDGVYGRLYADSLAWTEPLPVEVWPGDGSWLWGQR